MVIGKNEQVLVFGAGALGLGFLAQELAGEYDILFVDIPEKGRLLRALECPDGAEPLLDRCLI